MADVAASNGAAPSSDSTLERQGNIKEKLPEVFNLQIMTATLTRQKRWRLAHPERYRASQKKWKDAHSGMPRQPPTDEDRRRWAEAKRRKKYALTNLSDLEVVSYFYSFATFRKTEKNHLRQCLKTRPAIYEDLIRLCFQHHVRAIETLKPFRVESLRAI